MINGIGGFIWRMNHDICDGEDVSSYRPGIGGKLRLMSLIKKYTRKPGNRIMLNIGKNLLLQLLLAMILISVMILETGPVSQELAQSEERSKAWLLNSARNEDFLTPTEKKNHEKNFESFTKAINERRSQIIPNPKYKRVEESEINRRWVKWFSKTEYGKKNWNRTLKDIMAGKNPA